MFEHAPTAGNKTRLKAGNMWIPALPYLEVLPGWMWALCLSVEAAEVDFSPKGQTAKLLDFRCGVSFFLFSLNLSYPKEKPKQDTHV